MNLQEIINRLFCGACEQRYNALLDKHRDCEGLTRIQSGTITRLEDEIERLTSRPAPPELTYTVEKDTAWVSGVLLELGLEIVRLPLGPEFCLTDKDTFIDFVAYDWVDQLEYHKFFRCGNFTISFKAHSDQFGINQVGIVLDYVAGHSYNLIIFIILI